MASLFRKTVTRPLPSGAEIIGRKGDQWRRGATGRSRGGSGEACQALQSTQSDGKAYMVAGERL